MIVPIDWVSYPQKKCGYSRMTIYIYNWLKMFELTGNHEIIEINKFLWYKLAGVVS
jgi:hypothetical protein